MGWSEALANDRSLLNESRIERPDDPLRMIAEAFETSLDGIAITDSAGCFIYMNAAHISMFEFDNAPEILGKPWTELYTEEVASWFVSFVMPRLFSNGSWRGEVVGRSKTGKDVFQEVSLSVHAATGGIVCQTRDISQRHFGDVQGAQLHQILLNVEKKAFLRAQVSALCHDVANFLAIARHRLSRARVGLANCRDIQPDLSAIDEALSAAVTLSSQGLSAAEVAGSISDFDAVSLLVSVAELCDGAYRDVGGICVLSEVGEGRSSCDPMALARSLTNLIKNAAESGSRRQIEVVLCASPPSFHLDAAYEEASLGGPMSGGALYVAVQDDGCGVSAPHMLRIFDAFFTTKKGLPMAGCGSGLTMLRELCERGELQVVVRSSLGAGSQFVMVIPATGVL
jgi:PAS domain S-box-containing protein